MDMKNGNGSLMGVTSQGKVYLDRFGDFACEKKN